MSLSSNKSQQPSSGPSAQLAAPDFEHIATILPIVLKGITEQATQGQRIPDSSDRAYRCAA
ncbi:MAG: hypothetical protein JSS38_01550 [Nitrospira sp.]|nr:hypothetical protein [Nitrospira sp.]